MKYKGSYFEMWDAWYLNLNDTVHAFHLKNHAGENWNVGHLRTQDLLHFQPLRDVLETLPEEQYPDDCLGKFTGCAVEKDGICYLYYTMRDSVRSEKIGLATSDDMEHFAEYPHNPVLTPDPNLFVVHPRGEKTDCRDMLIVYDDASRKYYGYFAAMANVAGRGELGVIGVVESTDLIAWRNQKIVYVPEFNGVVEVPNVFRLNGKWYMTLMTSSQYGSRGATNDPNLNCLIIWASADAPDGMFQCGEENVFIGSTRIDGGYALRCVEHKGKLYAMYIDRSEYGSSISLPKEVRAVDGKINPYYADILQTLRTGRQWDEATFTAVPTAFAWKNVQAGKLTRTESGVAIQTFSKSLQAYKADAVSARNLEVEFTLSGDFDEAGAVLYCASHDIEDVYEPRDPNGLAWNDYVWNAYSVSFSRRENIVSLNQGMISPVTRRRFDFTDKKSLHVRVLAVDGQFELYIDDVLFLQCGMKTEKRIAPGLFAFSGCARFENFRAYELEE